jgi:hypothetical protein
VCAALMRGVALSLGQAGDTFDALTDDSMTKLAGLALFTMLFAVKNHSIDDSQYGPCIPCITNLTSGSDSPTRCGCCTTRRRRAAGTRAGARGRARTATGARSRC